MPGQADEIGVSYTVDPDGGVSIERNLTPEFEQSYADYMRSIGREDLLNPESAAGVSHPQ